MNHAGQPRKIILTIFNEPAFDQRMIRICSSLVGAGYQVLLVGRGDAKKGGLAELPFEVKLLPNSIRNGFLSYVFFNFRLFFYLCFRQRADAVCAIDLDTILPCYLFSLISGCKRVYDAHELFCEMKEIVSRPLIYRCWKLIEKFAVPRFKAGYTVNQPIAAEFEQLYGMRYAVIRNVPVSRPIVSSANQQRYIIYQGAVNEGRSFETLIPAMKTVALPLVICGEGNFLQRAKELVETHGLEKKVIFKGKVLPRDLWPITCNATCGVTLFDGVGKSNVYSLANRFFDYIQAGLPQVCVDFPVYRQINDQYQVALLTSDLSCEKLALTLNNLVHDHVLYATLQQNCLKARAIFNWQNEEKILIAFYQQLFA